MPWAIEDKVCPVLSAFLRSAVNHWPGAEQERLARMTKLASKCQSTTGLAERRAVLALNFIMKDHRANWYRAAGFDAQARQHLSIPVIRDRKTYKAALSISLTLSDSMMALRTAQAMTEGESVDVLRVGAMAWDLWDAWNDKSARDARDAVAVWDAWYARSPWDAWPTWDPSTTRTLIQAVAVHAMQKDVRVEVGLAALNAVGQSLRDAEADLFQRMANIKE